MEIKFFKSDIEMDNGELVTLRIDYDDDFNILGSQLLDISGGSLNNNDLLNMCLDFSKDQIKPGDLYEDCRYRKVRCISNDNGEILGYDEVDNSIGFCDENHCGIVKLG